MPYAAWADVNPAIRGIRPRVSLEQANLIAARADEMEADGVEAAWPMAIELFRKEHTAQGGKWVKQSAEECGWFYDLASGELLTEEGNANSGNRGHKGIPGQRGGSISRVTISGHAYQRMSERHLFKEVKQKVAELAEKEVPEGDWFVKLTRGERVRGYMVGTGGVVKTVLGAWYNPQKLNGMMVEGELVYDLTEGVLLWEKKANDPD